MRRTAVLSLGCLLCWTLSLVSCKDKSNNDKYFYNALRDTSAPRLDIRTPSEGSVFQFGDDVNVVGTVTDLEVTGKSGKLQSLNLEITQYDPSNDTLIKTLMKRTKDVDGLAGYTIIEKYSTPAWGAATIYCRLDVVATDYSTRVGRDSLFFTITP